jgi:predicted esterase YcpF (UPF0227 family)
MNAAAERVREHLALAHQGRASGIPCRELAVKVGATPREVRQAVTELREAGIAVCGHPLTGYYLAETAEDLEHTCRFLRARALHSLRLESALRKQPMPDLLGQVRMELEGSK